MKFTNIRAHESFAVLSNVNETGKLGFVIAKNARKIRDELIEYETKINEIVSKYGTPRDDGFFEVKPEDVQAYLAERKEYDDVECDIPVLTVDEDTFCSGNLTSQQMYVLDWMVDT